MIELLVVIAIATIGVVYTSSTGEAESNLMADKSAKDALNEAEGQSGIGILGIDVVARKMRKVVGLRDGAVSADSIAEYRADADEEPDMAEADLDLDYDDPEMVDDWRAHRDEAAMADADDAFDDDDDDLAAYDEDWDEDDEWDEPPARARLAQDDTFEFDQPATPRASERPVRDMPRSAARDWAQDAEADRVAQAAPVAAKPAAPQPAAPKPAPRPAAIDTRDAPIVEEFDPAQDEIVIGYRPGEAGNGRIGIIEDPLRPGSAAVTLGGRCVAVVIDAFGKVRAHHIDLVCDDGDEDLAA